jgi:hypothetical protein
MQKFLILLLSVYTINAIAETSLIIKYKPTANEIALLNSKSISTDELNANMRKPLSKEKISVLNELLSSLDKLFKKSHTKIIHDQTMAIGAHKLILNGDLNESQQEELLKSIKNTVPNIDYVEFDGLAYPD